MWKIFNQTRKKIIAISRSILKRPPVMKLKRALFDGYMSFSAGRLPYRMSPETPKQVNQLLIFGDMGLGNFLMFTPALAALRKQYQDAEIVVLFFKSRGAEHVAKENPDIDRLVSIEMPKRSGIFPFLRLIRTCSKEKIRPDMIVARWNGNPYVSLLTMWLRAAYRVGHVSSAGFKGYYDDVFNFPVPMSEDEHEVERNLDLVRVLGIQPQSSKMYMPVCSSNRREAEELITKRGFDISKLVCLQTGSSDLQHWKRWPESHWIQLTEKLDRLGYECVFIGSRDEAKIARSIIEKTNLAEHGDRINVCGELSLNGTAALLENSVGIICNDSGLMHVAASVGTPIVGLFGPTEFDRTRPYVDNCTILRKDCDCNHGTLFDRQTLKKIEACDRPCLKKTLPDEVIQCVVKNMPIEEQ